MAHKFPYYTKIVALNVLLHSARYIGNPIARQGGSNSLIQGFFRYIHQPLGGHAASANGHRFGCVTNKTTIRHAYVQTHNITKCYLAFATHAVNNFVIDRNARMAWKLAIT